MNFLELLAAISIAFYAMVGGAFLNAAITAPENMLRLLSHMWESVFTLTAYGVLTFLVALVMGIILSNEYTSVASNPFIWSSAAQIAVVGIFWVCRLIVEVLVEPEETTE